MIRIVNRYLTGNPKTDAAKKLRKIILQLPKLSRTEFTTLFKEWQIKWEYFLNERKISVLKTTGKKRQIYTHKRLRSAVLSIKKHLPYLFTFEDYPDLKIPKTTNTPDGHFSDLKNKLRNHNAVIFA
ncbi:MAG: hypothetical protein LBR08_05215 [Bacteroidales bacterium]|jgi:hypothetical protein|nr:hypothetical protein [Bacteroidales bacterium]